MNVDLVLYVDKQEVMRSILPRSTDTIAIDVNEFATKLGYKLVKEKDMLMIQQFIPIHMDIQDGRIRIGTVAASGSDTDGVQLHGDVAPGYGFLFEEGIADISFTVTPVPAIPTEGSPTPNDDGDTIIRGEN